MITLYQCQMMTMHDGWRHFRGKINPSKFTEKKSVHEFSDKTTKASNKNFEQVKGC